MMNADKQPPASTNSSQPDKEIAVVMADIVVDLLRRGMLSGAPADQLAPLALRYTSVRGRSAR